MAAHHNGSSETHPDLLNMSESELRDHFNKHVSHNGGSGQFIASMPKHFRDKNGQSPTEVYNNHTKKLTYVNINVNPLNPSLDPSIYSWIEIGLYCIQDIIKDLQLVLDEQAKRNETELNNPKVAKRKKRIELFKKLL